MHALARSLFVLTLAACSLAIGSSPARADIRLFEERDGDQVVRFFELTGFLQPGVVLRLGESASGATDDGPWLQRARFGFRAQLHEWLVLRAEIDLAPSPALTDAYVELPLLQWLQVRAGQFIVPFLLTYQFHEQDLGFLDRAVYAPISPDRPVLRFLAPRDVGVAIHGSVGDLGPENDAPVVEYMLGAFIGRGANFDRNEDDVWLYAARARVHLLGRPAGVAIENDLARNVVPRVAVGLGAYSNCDDRGNWNRGATFDAEFRFQGVYASAAVTWFHNGSADSGGLADLLAGDACRPMEGPGGVLVDYLSRGLHVQAQYVLPPAWFFDGQSLEVRARADVVDPRSPYDPDDVFFGGDTSTSGYVAPTSYTDDDNAPSRLRLTFGLRWYPTRQHNFRLDVDYQHNRETEDVVIDPSLSMDSVDNDILWLQLTAGI